MKINRKHYKYLALLVLLLLLAVYIYNPSTFEDFLTSTTDGGSSTSTTGGGTTPPQPPSSSDPTWTQVGSGSGWSFITNGDYHEWDIDLGDIRIGLTGDYLVKIEVSRRWNFKDTPSCPCDDAYDCNLVWCLHDSMNQKIWGATDTNTITIWKTETVTQAAVYDGRAWRMFIGNNFPCDVDCHWNLKVYVYQ